MPGAEGVFVVGLPVYATALITMAWRAIARVRLLEDFWTWTKLCSCIGGICFVISDTFIGFHVFYGAPYIQVRGRRGRGRWGGGGALWQAGEAVRGRRGRRPVGWWWGAELRLRYGWCAVGTPVRAVPTLAGRFVHRVPKVQQSGRHGKGDLDLSCTASG